LLTELFNRSGGHFHDPKLKPNNALEAESSCVFRWVGGNWRKYSPCAWR